MRAAHFMMSNINIYVFDVGVKQYNLKKTLQ